MSKIKKIGPHLLILLLFVVISLVYFSPILEGKMLEMEDISRWKGMSKEVTTNNSNINKCGPIFLILLII